VAGDSLEQIRQQLQDWRAGRKLGERIPAPLWAAAVDAAREQGLHRVATAGALRSTIGLRGRKRTAGNSIRPSRCSISIIPRQTMSRSAPLGCTQFHASHSLADRRRRLKPGCSAMSLRMKTRSSSVIGRWR